MKYFRRTRKELSKQCTCNTTKGVAVVFLIALMSTFYEFHQSAKQTKGLQETPPDHPIIKGLSERALQIKEESKEDAAGEHGVATTTTTNEVKKTIPEAQQPQQPQGQEAVLPQAESGEEEQIIEPEEARTTSRNKKRKRRKGRKASDNNNNKDTTTLQEEPAATEPPEKDENDETDTEGNDGDNEENETDENENDEEDIESDVGIDDATTAAASGGSISTTRTFSLDAIQVPDEVESMIQQVMTKWNLTIWDNTTETLHNILRHVWLKDNKYNKKNDFVIFFHPMKSGGTSVSAILDRIGGGGAIVPGSHASGHFNNKAWKEKYAIEAQKSKISKQDWWAKYKVIYSHHGYRRMLAPHAEVRPPSFLYKLVKGESKKRARQITMVREPLSFVASNMNEWICRNAKWQRKAKQYNWPTRKDSPNACYGYTLADLTDIRIKSNTIECANKTFTQLKAMKTQKRRSICKAFQKGRKDDTPQCKSGEAFMRQFAYREKVLEHMNHFPRSQKSHIPIESYVASSMGYLGGVDTIFTNSTTNTTDYYGDMMWFGITERMKESMCLLHYQLQMPFVKTPRRRVQECRPVTFWTESEKAKFYDREPLAVHMHNAANAILDVQLAKMKQEIQMHLKATGKNATHKHEYPFVPNECWADEDDATVASTNK